MHFYFGLSEHVNLLEKPDKDYYDYSHFIDGNVMQRKSVAENYLFESCKTQHT